MTGFRSSYLIMDSQSTHTMRCDVYPPAHHFLLRSVVSQLLCTASATNIPGLNTVTICNEYFNYSIYWSLVWLKFYPLLTKVSISNVLSDLGIWIYFNHPLGESLNLLQYIYIFRVPTFNVGQRWVFPCIFQAMRNPKYPQILIYTWIDEKDCKLVLAHT